MTQSDSPIHRRRPSPASVRGGFTLIEVLIVVVIMAILAAVVIPTVSDGTTDAKNGTVASNLHILRSQIELYKQQHNSQTPANLTLLTQKTNLAGQAGTTAAFTLGPYIRAIPVNPFTQSAKVTAAATNPPTSATGAPDAGWLYHAATGGIWVDHADLLTE